MVKQRKRISPVSKKRREQNKIYAEKKRLLFIDHPHCQACVIRGFKNSQWSTELHHTKGRAGTLFLDERYFLAVCKKCHRWCHENIAEARKLGLIAEIGKWNNPRG